MHVSLIDVSSGSCFQCFDTVAWVPVTGRSLTCKYMLQRLLGAGGGTSKAGITFGKKIS